MIKVEVKGDYSKTQRYLKNVHDSKVFDTLQGYAEQGVEALASATPAESGRTASSWAYKIEKKAGSYSIVWTNTHINEGVNIAIILQYGHGTGTGGYVQGRDYINPAMRPVFDNIADAAWKAVTSDG